MIDLARARRETPGCEHLTHLNNAGAALMPTSVLQTVTRHLELEAYAGGYEAARRETQRVEGVYHSAAALLGCNANEIAVVENATRAWDMGFYAIAFQPGERILTSQAEYASNFIAYLQVTKRREVTVEVIPNDEYGQVSVEALSAMMDERVRLIAITHVPTNGGLVNPAAAIGQVAKAWGALYLLDACQSVGQLPLNVCEIGCDLLSATSRKYLRGPRGVGLLYVSSTVLESLEPPFLDLHAATWVAPDRFEMRPDARRFENWECSIALKLGFGAAIDYALAWGLEAIWTRVRALGADLRTQLATIPGLELHDLGREPCGIISFTLSGVSADMVKSALAEQQITVNVSRAPSTLLDMKARGLAELVRASVHYYNSEEELRRFCAALKALRKEGVA